MCSYLGVMKEITSRHTLSLRENECTVDAGQEEEGEEEEDDAAAQDAKELLETLKLTRRK